MEIPAALFRAALSWPEGHSRFSPSPLPLAASERARLKTLAFTI
jgi:hypothetical protein